MKTLFLVRHAKSSWDEAALADIERPLNDRGKRDAPRMGRRLAKRDVKIDLLISSPARRAIKTARVFARKLNYRRKDLVVDQRLYPGNVRGLQAILQNLGNTCDCVMLVGHHPALSNLAHRFSAEIAHMPTCAVAEFTFKADKWQDVRRTALTAARLERPKRR
jgi:phosphohistidine phosphatase